MSKVPELIASHLINQTLQENLPHVHPMNYKTVYMSAVTLLYNRYNSMSTDGFLLLVEEKKGMVHNPMYRDGF